MLFAMATGGCTPSLRLSIRMPTTIYGSIRWMRHLVAPGEPSLLNFSNRQPPLQHGMHVNLYNNVWGTNFPMWYAEDARFRFVLRFRL